MGGGMRPPGRLAPAALEELGQPLLQPDRRAVVRQRRDGVVDQLVVHAVQPGVPVGQRARRGHHQARPLAERDGAGAGHLGHRQRRDRGQIGRAAIELDPDRHGRLEAEIVVQRGVGRLDGVARVGDQHRVLGRVADHRVRRALFLEFPDGVAGRLGQLRQAARLGRAPRALRRPRRAVDRAVVVAGQEPLVAVEELGLGAPGAALFSAASAAAASLEAPGCRAARRRSRASPRRAPGGRRRAAVTRRRRTGASASASQRGQRVRLT